jgi:hypothetical protein
VGRGCVFCCEFFYEVRGECEHCEEIKWDIWVNSRLR